MATSNVLQITQDGLDAIADANAGGFLINVTNFMVGSSSTAPTIDDKALEGTIYYAGAISVVEVISSGVAQFTLDLPPGNTASYVITELGLFLDNGVMFARGVFANPTEKDTTVGVRLFAIVTATNCNLTTINATLGDVYSIPSVAMVATLPAPNTSSCNTIAVMDLNYNLDNTSAGSIAIKYGEGGLMWSFLGYSRLYFGAPDSATGQILTAKQFNVAAMIANAKPAFVNNELVVVQVVSGSGQGRVP